MEPTPIPRVKVCCIQSVAEARAAVRAGAAALGLVSEMPSGPGVIPEERIAAIAAAVPPPVAPFLLTCGQDVPSLVAQQRRVRVGTLQLCDRLPSGAHAELARLSPITVVPRLRTRLLIAHGADDDSIPFTESLRLAEAVGSRARVVVLQTFHHTGPARVWTSLRRRAADTAALLLLTDEMLRTPRRP